MSTPSDVRDVFTWLQREVKEGGSLHRYLLPDWVEKHAILLSDAASAREPSQRVMEALKNYACTAGQSEWIRLPIPSIESIEVKGVQTDDAMVRIYFDLVINISGKVRCASGCSLPDVDVDLRLRLPLVYSQPGIMFVLPSKLKMLLWMVKILRGSRKIADLDPEVRAIVEGAISPLIRIVMESADLLCSAQLDLPGLLERLQEQIDWMAIPDEQKA